VNVKNPVLRRVAHNKRLKEADERYKEASERLEEARKYHLKLMEANRRIAA